MVSDVIVNDLFLKLSAGIRTTLMKKINMSKIPIELFI